MVHFLLFVQNSCVMFLSMVSNLLLFIQGSLDVSAGRSNHLFLDSKSFGNAQSTVDIEDNHLSPKVPYFLLMFDFVFSLSGIPASLNMY